MKVCGILLFGIYKIPKVLEVRSKVEDKHHFLVLLHHVRTGFPEVTTRPDCGRSLSEVKCQRRKKQMPAL